MPPAFDPFDDDGDDTLVPPQFGPISQPLTGYPLPSAESDPRATLARILEAFAESFGAEAGAQVDAVLTRVALMLTQYAHGVRGLRFTITGPTGAGKTRLLHVISSVLGVPSVILPVVDVAETGWKGAQIGDVCRILHPHLFRRHESRAHRVDVPTQLVALPAVLMLDELDKLATAPTIDGGRLDGSAMASRLGRMQSLLPVLDPLSTMLVQSDDASIPFRWSLRNAVVLCSGAFMQLPQDRPHSPADLVRVGLLPELVDRIGPVMTLPSPSAATRRTLAFGAVQDIAEFAETLGVRITGVDAFVATLPAPGFSHHYVSIRGFMDFVRQRMLAAVAEALAQQRTGIDLRDVPEEA